MLMTKTVVQRKKNTRSVLNSISTHGDGVVAGLEELFAPLRLDDQLPPASPSPPRAGATLARGSAQNRLQGWFLGTEVPETTRAATGDLRPRNALMHPPPSRPPGSAAPVSARYAFSR